MSITGSDRFFRKVIASCFSAYLPGKRWRDMRTVSFLALCALVLLWGVSCSRETTYTLAYGENRSVMVAEDLETMRKVIDVSMIRKHEDLPLTDFLSKQKIFLVRAGTKVEVKDAHLFGRNVRIHILEGEYSGRDGWVHKSMLHRTLSTE